MLNRIMKDESGVLTFEWILLITLLVIGIVGGIAAIRDALIIEAGETAGAIVALDHSYFVADPVEVLITNNDEGSAGGGNGEIVDWQSGDAEGAIYKDEYGIVKIQAPDVTDIRSNDDSHEGNWDLY